MLRKFFNPETVYVVLCLLPPGLMLNMLPVWLAELRGVDNYAPEEVGWIATVSISTLCLGFSVVLKLPASTSLLALGSSATVAIASYLLINAEGLSITLILATTVGVGLGVQFAGAVSAALASGNPLPSLSAGVSFGVFVSVVVLFAFPLFGVPVLASLPAVCAVLALYALTTRVGTGFGVSALQFVAKFRPLDLLYFPFFLLMGGMWAFAAVYAEAEGIDGLAHLFAIALLISAIGALLPSYAKNQHIVLVAIGCLLISAVSGGSLFLTSTMIGYAVCLIVNSVGVFTFLPIYLERVSRADDEQTNVAGLALYAGGFAAGGFVAGLIIEMLGYVGFALIVISSGGPAIFAFLRSK